MSLKFEALARQACINRNWIKTNASPHNHPKKDELVSKIAGVHQSERNKEWDNRHNHMKKAQVFGFRQHIYIVSRPKKVKEKTSSIRAFPSELAKVNTQREWIISEYY